MSDGVARNDGGRLDRLDHLRGLAAFMVFAWHFIHVQNRVPPEQSSWIPLLEEGHTGVSLFMVLSGYLFARIVDGSRINYPVFLLSRLRRLGPLLLVGLLVAYAPVPHLWTELPLGLILPLWKNGCWSVAVELQFYVLLPAILFAVQRWPATLVYMLAAAIAARAAIYAHETNLRDLAYFSLLGRIDQLLIGIGAWRLMRDRRASSALFLAGFGAFLAALVGFDLAGGFRHTARSPIWIVWPLIEGLGFALLIVWYVGAAWKAPKLFGFVGRTSYSMYILHFSFVVPLGLFAADVLGAKGVYAMAAFSIAAFLALLPLAWLSWRLLERPFMGGGRRYLMRSPARTNTASPDLAESVRTAA